MNKPWFKFSAMEWLSGSVQLLTDAEKGTYIDIISMLWKENGVIQNNNILHRKLRIDTATACDRINSYCELGILVCKDDELSVKFISDQISDIQALSEKNSENAKKRWSKKDTSMRPNANKKRREEIRRDKKRKEERENREDKNQSEKLAFDCFRKKFPGRKRGLDTEFENLVKKHSDWKKIVFDLEAILDTQINCRKVAMAAGEFVPEWKNLSTWINQRCWEEEYSPQRETSGGLPIIGKDEEF